MDRSGGVVRFVCRRYGDIVEMRRKKYEFERGDCRSYVRRVAVFLDYRLDYGRISRYFDNRREIVGILDFVGACYGRELDMLF